MTNTSTMLNLSALIKAKRREAGVGLRKAAEESGVSASTLSRLERGISAKMPDTATLKSLSEWIGVSLSELMNEKGTKKVSKAPEPSTTEQVEVYLRADKNLSSESANALASTFTALYNQFTQSPSTSRSTKRKK